MYFPEIAEMCFYTYCNTDQKPGTQLLGNIQFLLFYHVHGKYTYVDKFKEYIDIETIQSVRFM